MNSQQSTVNMMLSYRWVYLIEVFVLGDGVVDPFLDRQDVLLIVQVAGGLPSYLDTSRCRQSCQVHPRSRLKKRTCILKQTEFHHVDDWLSSKV